MEKKNQDILEVDECIEDAMCQGNCEHVGCSMAQLRTLSLMKNQGGRRTSPVQQVIQRLWVQCPQCSFNSDKKNELNNHVINAHGNQPSCTFCLVRFNTKEALSKHIEEQHKENTQVIRQLNCPQCNFTTSETSQLDDHVMKEHINHPSCPFCLVGYQNQGALRKHIGDRHNDNKQIVRERRQSNKGPCIFYLQPRGCKKGTKCDFSHERGAQHTSIKVCELCLNGPGCTWTPRCRYVHPEDGEIIPPRAPRQEARDRREEGGRPLSCEQGLGAQDLSHPPPGNTMRHFPVLGLPQRPSVFRINPQSSTHNQ